MFGVSTHADYSTMSKDEVAHAVGESFGQARKFIERGEVIPIDVWSAMNLTVSALCQRVGIQAPAQLVTTS
jgi:hypothetical protein